MQNLRTLGPSRNQQKLAKSTIYMYFLDNIYRKKSSKPKFMTRTLWISIRWVIFAKLGFPSDSTINFIKAFQAHVFLRWAIVFADKPRVKQLGLSSVLTSASFFSDQAKMNMRKNSRNRFVDFFRKTLKKTRVYFFFDESCWENTAKRLLPKRFFK